MKTDIRQSSYMALPGLRPGVRFFGMLNAQEIITYISTFTGISISVLKSKTRRADVVEARHIAMYCIRKHTGSKLIFIARIFNRDHTSVIHGINNVKNLCFSDPEFKQRVLSIENDLQYY